MCAYTGVKDVMRLCAGGLKPDELDGALATLLGSPSKDPAEDAHPLYRYQEKAELVAVMPIFDWWGIVPDGHVRTRENLLTVVLDSSGSDIVKASEGTMEDPSTMRPKLPPLAHLRPWGRGRRQHATRGGAPSTCRGSQRGRVRHLGHRGARHRGEPQ